MVRDEHGMGEADNEHPGIEEMRKVFNPELASAAYVPFLCLLGKLLLPFPPLIPVL